MNSHDEIGVTIMALNIDKFVSADSHLVEPEDLYVTRMDRRWREEAPHMEVRDGARGWVVKGLYPLPEDNPIMLDGDEKQRSAMDTSKGGRHEKIRPGGLEPNLRLLDQDADHIAAEVLYPHRALLYYGIQDADYQRECLRVYNDFAAQFAATNPQRLLAAGMLPFRGPLEWAIKEAERCAAIGLRELMIPNTPTRPFQDPYFEPLWAVLEDIGLPIVTHTATAEQPLDMSVSDVPLNAWVVDEKIVNMARCLARLIASGVPQRYPRLRFVMVECGIGWIAGMLRFMDHWWEDHHKWMEPRLDQPPSFYFKRQFWTTFEDDRPGILTRHLLNPDHLMWGSDYPHTEGTFPHSRERIEKDFADIPEAETRRMVRDNAAEFYGLSL